MKKLSEFKDEQALDLLAEVFEPVVSIFADKNFLSAVDGENKLSAVRIAIRDHKHAVMKILAAMDGVPVSEYHCNVFALPIRLAEIISEVMEEPELMTFFTSSSRRAQETPSGSTTESIEESEV